MAAVDRAVPVGPVSGTPTPIPASPNPEPAPLATALGLLRGRAVRMTFVLLAMWALLAVHPSTREAFATPGNLSNLTVQVAEIVIVGVGMTFVLLLGGIDLSVGAGIALYGVVAAKLQIDGNASAPVAIAAALAAGLVVGLWHGVLVTRFRVPPFIATLAGFLSYRGLALVLSDARGLSPFGQDFQALASRLSPASTHFVCTAFLVSGLGLLLRRRMRRTALRLPQEPAVATALRASAMGLAFAFFTVVYRDGMPVPVLLAALAVALGAFLLHRTLLGRYAVAIGGNVEAARLSGVPVTAVIVTIYTLTALLTAVAGLVAAARTNGVTPGNAGLMRELHVVTAVVIGGTSLTGGRATLLGSVVGALVFGTLSNGMNLLDVSSHWQLVLTGGILLLASLLDAFSTARRP